MKEVRAQKYVKDVLIVVLSVGLAVLLAQSRVLETFILRADGLYMLDAFVAGIFFTSVFTTAPAMVVLGVLGSAYPIPYVALAGALGAVIGDGLIFVFLRRHVTNNISDIIVHMKSGRMRHVMKYRFARWSLVLLGGLIIASPFPDELGLTIMGISKIPLRAFAVVSFIFNAAGIVAVSLVARGL
ncbi:hypothetical protein KW799_02260 [Candidatus Parcubacteria bacterium]|nr:hypothetical protein [Candidatus Parcubacteria bacterium]